MNQPSLFEQARFAETAEIFVDQVAGFDEFGQGTVVETVDGVPYLKNEFWTAGQRQAHSIHEISLPGLLQGAAARVLYSPAHQARRHRVRPLYGARHDSRARPRLMRRQAIGNDVNPLSVLLTRPRLRAISPQAVDAALKTVDWSRGEVEREDLLAFYHPATLKKLGSAAPVDGRTRASRHR